MQQTISDNKPIRENGFPIQKYKKQIHPNTQMHDYLIKLKTLHDQSELKTRGKQRM